MSGPVGEQRMIKVALYPEGTYDLGYMPSIHSTTKQLFT